MVRASAVAKLKSVARKARKVREGIRERKEIVRRTYHYLMEQRRRGQTNLANVLIGIFVVVFVIITFSIMFGFMEEVVAPKLGLNSTLPKIQSTISTGQTIVSVASALVLLLAVVVILFLAIRYIRTAGE